MVVDRQDGTETLALLESHERGRDRTIGRTREVALEPARIGSEAVQQHHQNVRIHAVIDERERVPDEPGVPVG